jgi:cytochrome P450
VSLLFNPFDAGLRADPYPAYRRLRELEPVHRSPLGFWALSRHADVVAVQPDPRFGLFSARVLQLMERATARDGPAAAMAAVARRWQLLTVPEEHRRFRAIVGRCFGPAGLEAHRRRLEAAVAAHVAALPAHGRIDFVQELALKLPVDAMADLLGLPAVDRERYRGWAAAIGRALESAVDVRALRPLGEVMTASAEALGAVVAERCRAPGDDLLSALIGAEHEGRRLADDEVVAYVSMLLGAAHETTSNLLANGLHALLRHPDQLSLLRACPELVPDAIEELIRFDPPAQLHGRWTQAAVEIGGQVIPEGAKVLLLVGAANRDPDRFPDPERLDVRRSDTRHASFGLGPHYCLGSGLVRQEAQLALRLLLDRYPRLGRIAAEPSWRAEPIARRALTSLVVDVDG